MKPAPNYVEVFIQFLSSEAGGRSSALLLQEPYKPIIRIADMLPFEAVVVDGPDDEISPGAGTYATLRVAESSEKAAAALVEGAQFQVIEGRQIVGVGVVVRR